MTVSEILSLTQTLYVIICDATIEIDKDQCLWMQHKPPYIGKHNTFYGLRSNIYNALKQFAKDTWY